ncbi:MAG: InlB B-repeat-containing protein [Clostridiales bacterium]|nr:InlB B-repeat-containing protein [Clostridiales bacterium]
MPPLTIDGPDVVCAQQDYEFTVTPPTGVSLEESFGYDTGLSDSGVGLTIDEDGVGHGVVSAEWYDLQTNRFTLTARGTDPYGDPVPGTKTVQVSPEHIFVDGVCGCGAVQQYTVTYDGGEGSDPVTDVKTHGKDLTLRGETFTLDGFVQTGWVDKEGAVYKLGATYTEDQDVTLYPVFEKLITLTVPYTTTVELSDVGVPGEKTFTLALIGDSASDKDKSNVTITGSVTTNGKGSYNGTLTFTGTERTLWVMLSEGAFVRQVNAGADGWTVDDTVWGVLMEEIPVAYAMGDDATASGYTVYVVPASIDGNGYYYIDWENLQAADMSFTNTYTAHVYELKHDATHHWDECQCKDVQNKELHKYGDWKVTKEATQTAKGEKEHTCTVCGYTEKAEIPMRTNVPTGDDSSFALWAALFTLSAAAVTATATMGKRKKAGK